MAKKAWLKNGKAIMRDGKVVMCEECPCGCGCGCVVCQSGTAPAWIKVHVYMPAFPFVVDPDHPDEEGPDPRKEVDVDVVCWPKALQSNPIDGSVSIDDGVALKCGYYGVAAHNGGACTVDLTLRKSGGNVIAEISAWHSCAPMAWTSGLVSGEVIIAAGDTVDCVGDLLGKEVTETLEVDYDYGTNTYSYADGSVEIVQLAAMSDNCCAACDCNTDLTLYGLDWESAGAVFENSLTGALFDTDPVGAYWCTDRASAYLGEGSTRLELDHDGTTFLQDIHYPSCDIHFLREHGKVRVVAVLYAEFNGDGKSLYMTAVYEATLDTACLPAADITLTRTAESQYSWNCSDYPNPTNATCVLKYIGP